MRSRPSELPGRRSQVSGCGRLIARCDGSVGTIGGGGHRGASTRLGCGFVVRARWRRGVRRLASGPGRKGYAVTAAMLPDYRALQDPRGACVADERQALDNAAFADRVIAVAAVFAAA